MDKLAVKQAWERLHKAKAALQSIETSKSLGQTEVAWSDFLTAASTIYSKLERGSRGDAKSQPWFGRIKNERKTDQLLSYVHHARNADEHGIAPITRTSSGYIAINGDVHVESVTFDGFGNLRIGKITGLNPERPPEIVFNPARVELLPVRDDRFGDIFNVPGFHMGRKLESQSLVVVARLAFLYLEKVVREASAL